MKKSVFFRILLAVILTVSVFGIASVVKADTSVPNPVITSITPIHPLQGQVITILGSNFLPYPAGQKASDLQVWFAMPNGGVNWVSAVMPGISWHQSDIEVKVPENLPSGVALNVFILRGNCSTCTSAKTPFSLILESRVFLPLVRISP